MKTIKLYEVPRSTIIDISEYEIYYNSELIKECMFLNLDGTVGRCEYKGAVFLIYANTNVKIK